MSQHSPENPLEVVIDNSNSVQTTAEEQVPEIDFSDSEYFHNRELSLLKFNSRVLQQARNPNHPLLERLIFLLIFSSNLDEFYEVRVSGLKKQLDFGRQRPGPDGKYPEQVLKEIHQIVRSELNEQYRILNEDLLPSLAQQNIHFLHRNEWSDGVIEWTKQYFFDEIIPVVSPLGLDPAHPFPRLVNKSLNFI
ncbi:MAG TPA: RNA degradosome polyphosphate kinase, partial [Gammaproteobacteria bacterium]|nr:RNA degradosome polyphosphate kinase [Gammaproteobacteria bacterium]